MAMQFPESIPVIDVGRLVLNHSDLTGIAAEIREACETHGFFYVVNHGVDQQLVERLDVLSRQFFAQDLDKKMSIRMELAGRAWRGYFPVGNELTLGKPDQKEGLYFGAELPNNHPKVKAAVPLHGQNLFPEIDEFRETVLTYMDSLKRLGHALMRGIALSLNLDADYFFGRYTSDPFLLFRIFHYPALPADDRELWSVGEHTDYGLLTILRQDDAGGLQIKVDSSWIDATPVPNAFVCNLGDMLDRMTGGLYRTTPHRVLNTSQKDRLSFPFFFDPNFDCEVKPIDGLPTARNDTNERWDKMSVYDFKGTYGDYLLKKVSHVFPDLGEKNL